MTEDEKLMQRALEALTAHVDLLGTMYLKLDAITALRERLAQPEQEPVTLPCCGYADTSAVKWNKYSGAVQCHHCGHTYTPLARPEQEPIAWANKDDLQNFDMRVRTNGDPFHTVPLYTAPLRREWQGLTDEDKAKLDEQYGDDTLAHLDAIEAKLKEKNT